MAFEYPENAADYDFLVITGSDSAAFDDKPWIHRLKEYIREIGEKRPTKLLGYCFGHQIIHLALGGSCEINPGGTEIGRVVVDLKDDARMLLRTKRKDFAVYLGHRDHVPELAPGFVSLGSTPPTPHQGAMKGHDILTWQVHPELPADLMLAFLLAQRDGTVTMNGGANAIFKGDVPGSQDLAAVDALWCGAKTVSWVLGNVLSDEELAERLRGRRTWKT